MISSSRYCLSGLKMSQKKSASCLSTPTRENKRVSPPPFNSSHLLFHLLCNRHPNIVGGKHLYKNKPLSSAQIAWAKAELCKTPIKENNNVAADIMFLIFILRKFQIDKAFINLPFWIRMIKNVVISHLFSNLHTIHHHWRTARFLFNRTFAVLRWTFTPKRNCFAKRNSEARCLVFLCLNLTARRQYPNRYCLLLSKPCRFLGASEKSDIHFFFTVFVHYEFEQKIFAAFIRRKSAAIRYGCGAVCKKRISISAIVKFLCNFSTLSIRQFLSFRD